MILLILYSTLVVVFWSFYIAFEDQKVKSEKKKTTLFFIPIFFIFMLPNNPGVTTVISPFLSTYALNFFQATETNEFFFFFLIIYVFNPLTFLFIFFTLVLVCFNIVSLLLLKQKAKSTTNLHVYNFDRNKISVSTTNKQGRIGFWSTVSSNLSFLSLGKST